ncbi:hypothetical protein [Alkalihalobacillus sp. CinArs1]|uniref:hypothetical protein n=1 Tax=Alkalihalobacillus sp. CinArs1 TaxID=2995314 RepID=UPI0022DE26DB|nr:hypothetical protein [Alkalihalobacillus sp. CinArs1]
MKSYLDSIYKRFKKYIWILLLIPIFTAGISYILEARTPETYTAYSEIYLGYFEYERYTEPRTVKDFLANTGNLEEYDLSMPASELSKQLKVGEKPGKIITLTLVGNDKKTVEKSLNEVTEGFIKQSDEKKAEMIAFYEEKIEKLESLPDAPESFIDKQEFLFELQDTINNHMRSTVINEPVTIKNTTGDPLKRAIFGFLVGFIISVFILVLPEFLKREEKE